MLDNNRLFICGSPCNRYEHSENYGNATQHQKEEVILNHQDVAFISSSIY